MFFDNMKTAAVQVGVLFVMAAIGFICCKIGIYSDKTGKATTDLLFYVITPCLIIQSFIDMEYSREMLKMFLISLLLGFTTHFIAIAMNKPFFSVKKSENNAIYKFGSIYGNVGFMALPLAKAILGTEGVFYCSSGVIAFNVLSFTHGVAVMNRDDKKFDYKRLVLNPGVISVLIGLPLFLFDVKLPVLIAQPIQSVSALNTPIAMIIFGTVLANTKLSTIFTDKRIYFVSLMKLIALPVVVLFAYKLCGIKGTLLTACTITASVPCANNTAMFAAKFGHDSSLASKTVSMTSVLSILTLPVIIAFAQSFGG